MSTLLLMACSQRKKPTLGPRPFIHVYNGPIWQQARNNYPHDRIAVISAEHGVLAPLAEIEGYDRVMDEERVVSLLNSRHEQAKFKNLVDQFDEVIVLGGELYQLFSLWMVALGMVSLGKVRFCCGSYLKQRAALNQYVREWKENNQ